MSAGHEDLVPTLFLNPPNFLAHHAVPIAGIGRGLLYFVTEIANAIRARNIWGEATALSAGAYRHMFGQPRIEDFFRLNRAAYLRFRATVEARWALSQLPTPARSSK